MNRVRLRAQDNSRILYAMAAGLAVAGIAALVVTYPAIFLGWLVVCFIVAAVVGNMFRAGGRP